MIRKDTDYAFRVLTHLAAGQGVATAGEAANRQNVPRCFAQKVLRRLVAAGILTARAGKGGGFALARTPRTVSMWEVVTAVQGPLQVNICVACDGACDREPACMIAVQWRALQERMARFLRRTTLADILKSKRGLERR